MERLKERFSFDLKQNYLQMNICPNILLLNKKPYLLYNFWNKRKEFLLLKNEMKDSRYTFNYIGFFSLGLNKFFNNNRFDYFCKWSSSLLKFSDLYLRILIGDNNPNKRLIEANIFPDYTIFDNIFLNYKITEKRNFFYFYKNKSIFQFFFKLSKKEKLRLRNCLYIHFFNYYNSLNDNYNNFIKIYNWRYYYNKNYIFNILLYIKNIIFQKIKKKINTYILDKKLKKFLFFLKEEYFFFLKKNIKSLKKYFFLRNFLNNKKIKYLLYLKNYFQHIFFIKNFNRRIFGFKFRFEKFRALRVFKEKFLPIIGHNIYKNFKKKYFFFFLKKFKNKNLFVRNLFKLNNISLNKFKFSSNVITDENFAGKKKKKIWNYRILKKLRKFYYIPDTKKTRLQVYRRFKKSVMRKFNRKKIKRVDARVTGFRFNLSVYNTRNRYKNRMRILALKKKSTPLFHYFKNKKNNYINIKGDYKPINHNEVPFFILRKYKLDMDKKKVFLKKNIWRAYKTFTEIKHRPIIENRRRWLFCFHNRSKKYKKFKTLSYAKHLKEKWKSFVLEEQKKEKIIIRRYNNRLNLNIKKKKKIFWFFQKVLLYWKNVVIFKKISDFFSIGYVKKSFFFLKKIYKYFFLMSIKFIVLFNFCKLTTWVKNKKKKNYIKKYIKIYFFFLKLILLIYLFIQDIHKERKIYKRKEKAWLNNKKKKYKFFFKKKILKKRKKKKKISDIYKNNIKKINMNTKKGNVNMNTKKGNVNQQLNNKKENFFFKKYNTYNKLNGK